jgi:hypothetical protein
LFYIINYGSKEESSKEEDSKEEGCKEAQESKAWLVTSCTCKEEDLRSHVGLFLFKSRLESNPRCDLKVSGILSKYSLFYVIISYYVADFKAFSV